MIFNFIALALIFLGSILTLLSAVGLVRMPCFYTRMQVTSKASTLGCIFLLMGACMIMGLERALPKSVGIILLLMFAAPMATHALAKCATRNDLRVPELEKSKSS